MICGSSSSRSIIYSLTPQNRYVYAGKRGADQKYVIDQIIKITYQVLENAKLFNNVSIREHLLTCLNNNKLGKSQPCSEQKLKLRDTRQSLYNKPEQNVRSLSLIDYCNFYTKRIVTVRNISMVSWLGFSNIHFNHIWG